jgi:chromosome segregation ATPase
MVICVKCGKEQRIRRSWAECEYDGNEYAGREHAWANRGEFIDELREKLPAFIKERIATWQKKYAENQAAFSERLASYQKKYAENQAASSERLAFYRKRQDEIQKTLNELQNRLNKIRKKKQDTLQAACTAYLSENLPGVVKEKKQRAMRSLLGYAIPCTIGVLIGLALIFLPLSIEITPFIIVPIMVLAVVILSKSVVKFLDTMRYAESQEVADKLAREWYSKHKISDKIDALESNIEAEKDKWNNFRRSLDSDIEAEKDKRDNSRRSLESDIEAEKDKWNKLRGSLERCIYSAERALVGSEEELLNYYNTDKQAKNWYLENIYDGEW